MKGLEPLNGGTKIHSLTFWLHPSFYIILAEFTELHGLFYNNTIISPTTNCKVMPLIFDTRSGNFLLSFCMLN